MDRIDTLIANAECCKVGCCSECDYCGDDYCERNLFDDIITALNEHKNSIDKCKKCLFEKKESEVQENDGHAENTANQ